MDNSYPICENCIFVDEPLDKDPCQECHRAFLAQRIKPNFVSKREPITNADRIRAMTDEELASYLTGVWYSFEEMPGMCDVCDMQSIQNCSDCWLDWLKQEATE